MSTNSKSIIMVKKNALGMFIVFTVCGALLMSQVGCRSDSRALEEKISRIESNLIPGPGIIIKGRPPTRATIAERMEAYRVPGISIAVIKDFKIEWAKGYGVKDKESNDPITPDTLFQAASISKPVAAAAALHYVDAGLLSLDENVNDKLKSWKVPENEFTQEKKVTLRCLLSHTAGLTVHGFRGYALHEEFPTLVQVLNGEKPANSAAILADKAPGGDYRYSGGGYTVMQQLLIDVLDKPFPEIMRATVLDPVGMENSTYEQPLPERLAAQAAKAHRTSGKLIKGNWHAYPEMAAAGLWTTPSDLCRFALEIIKAKQSKSDKLFSQAMAETMTTVVDNRYGLGFSVEAGSIGHGGSNEGYKCFLIFWPETGLGAAIMSNGDWGGTLYMEIVRSISEAYGWTRFAPREEEVVEIAPEELQKFAGLYQPKAGLKIKIIVEADRIFIDNFYVPPSGRQKLEIFPESEDSFFATEANAAVKFYVDDSGQVTGLRLNQSGRRREAKKIE